MSGSATRAIIVRRFAAPIEKLMAAWTTPQQISKWWPRANERLMFAQISGVIGGKIDLITVDPSGQEHEYRGVFREIVPGDFMIIDLEKPLKRQLVLQFLAFGAISELTLTESPIESAAEVEARKARWNSACDRLKTIVERDAPPELIKP